MSKAVYCSDLLETSESARFVQWNGNTLNTPYKAGLTDCAEGFAFCYGNWNDYMTVIAFAKNSNKMWGWSKASGNWVEYATKSDLTAINSGSVTKSSYVTDGAITLHKNGRTAVLSSEIGITLSGTQGTGTTIFTLPTGFRPATRLRIPCTTVISSEYVSRELQIDTNGTCSLQGPNAGTAVRATFSASFCTT